jgi:hypothetical protein
VFIFERTDKDKRIVIVANCSTEDFKLNLREPMKDFESNKIVKDSMLLAPCSFVILASTKEIKKDDKSKPATRAPKPVGVAKRSTPKKSGTTPRKNSPAKR